MNATLKYTYAVFDAHRDVAKSAAIGTIFFAYASLVIPSLAGTTFTTRTSTNARDEQNNMCVIVSATGNGNPYTVRMYLLKRMTSALTKIHSATNALSASAFAMTRSAPLAAADAGTSTSLVASTSDHQNKSKQKTKTNTPGQLSVNTSPKNGLPPMITPKTVK